MEKNEISNLVDVHKTLLFPLWGRAKEMQKDRPLLKDPKAQEILDSLNFDFSIFDRSIKPLSQASWIARSLYFDNRIRAFLSEHPGAVVVNIGSGLDTSFHRVDDGKVRWFDLDVPAVIQLRRSFFTETDRNTFIPKSVFDFSWIEQVGPREHIMFLLAGVIYYFTQDDIRLLLSRLSEAFPGCELVFDYSSTKGIALANKMVIDKGRTGESSYLVWGLDNIGLMKNLHPGVQVVHDMPMFSEFRKQFPWYKRPMFFLSDMLRVMSLAHLRICGQSIG